MKHKMMSKKSFLSLCMVLCGLSLIAQDDSPRAARRDAPAIVDTPEKTAFFSSDGAFGVMADGDVFRVWEIASERLLYMTQEVFPIVFAGPLSDNRMAVITADGSMKIWDIGSGKMEYEARNYFSDYRDYRKAWYALRTAAWSGGKRLLLAAESPDAEKNFLTLWDTEWWLELKLFFYTGTISLLAYSEEARVFAYHGGYGIHLLNTQTDEVFTTLYGHRGAVADMEFSPDGGKLVSGGDDGSLRIWDAASGSELATIQGHDAPITSVSFSPSGRYIISASMDGTFRIWNAETYLPERNIPHDSLGTVYSAVFNAQEDRILTYSSGDGLSLWGFYAVTELTRLWSAD